MDYKELIELSRKAAVEWQGTHEYYQAAVLITSLCDAIETLLAEREAQREVAEDITDDFIDFVTGGVQNAAPYCSNMRPECCERPGWCTGESKECRGFFPKAAKDPTPPDRERTEKRE